MCNRITGRSSQQGAPAKRKVAMSDNHLTILVVEPGNRHIGRSQAPCRPCRGVGRDIDATYPYEDPWRLYLTAAASLLACSQPPPRLEKRDPYDVVCGTFFLAGLGERKPLCL